jgi:hypothetical protein
VAAECGQVGHGLVDGRCVEIALPRHTRVAAFLTLRCFLQDQDLGAEFVRGDGSCHTCSAKSDDDDIGLHVPLRRN